MPPPGPPPVETTAKPIIAGVMYILALLIGLVLLPLGIAALSVAGTASTSGFPGMGTFAALGALFGIMIILGVVGCALAMILSFMRKKWMIAVIGGVLALVGLHLVFGLIGFILLLLSKKEFQS